MYDKKEGGNLAFITEMVNTILERKADLEVSKESTIKPIWKEKGNKKCDNIRGLALQNAISKITMKALADRLNRILTKHGILNQAQEAFLMGLGTEGAIGAVLGEWERFRAAMEGGGEGEAHAVFYDAKKAYDMVPWRGLDQAMKRIQIPSDFRQLVYNSLRGSTTRVRHAYGDTSQIEMKRGIKQGDPLSPLLYIIFMDMLHDDIQDLHLEPEDDRRKGPKRYRCKTPSKGYADDTVGMASNKERVEKLNECVMEFSDEFDLEMRADKSHYVARGPDGDINTKIEIWSYDEAGERITAPVWSNRKENKKGRLVEQDTVKYLKYRINIKGDEEKHINQMTSTVYLYCRTASSSKFSTAQAVYIFNVHLKSKLIYSMAHSVVTGEKLRKWDSSLVRTLQKKMGIRRTLSRDAVATIWGLFLPTDYYRETRIAIITEGLNRKDRYGEGMRESWDRRHRSRNSRLRKDWIWLQEHSMDIAKDKEIHTHKTKYNRDWKRDGVRTMMNPHSFPRKEDELEGGNVIIYTDGSHKRLPEGNQSSWAVIIENGWLRDNWREIHDGGGIYRRRRIGQYVTRLGGKLGGHTEASMDGEAEAIDMALRAVPANWDITLYTDSKTTMDRINEDTPNDTHKKISKGANWRRVDNAKRTIKIRAAMGGATSIEHVRSHTGSRDWQSNGNRVADLTAEEYREKGDIWPKKNWRNFFTLWHKGNQVEGSARKYTKRINRTNREKGWGASKSQGWTGDIDRINRYCRTVKGAGGSRVDLTLLLTRTMAKPAWGEDHESTDRTCAMCGEEKVMDWTHFHLCTRGGDNTDLTKALIRDVRDLTEGRNRPHHGGEEKMLWNFIAKLTIEVGKKVVNFKGKKKKGNKIERWGPWAVREREIRDSARRMGRLHPDPPGGIQTKWARAVTNAAMWRTRRGVTHTYYLNPKLKGFLMTNFELDTETGSDFLAISGWTERVHNRRQQRDIHHTDEGPIRALGIAMSVKDLRDDVRDIRQTWGEDGGIAMYIVPKDEDLGKWVDDDHSAVHLGDVKGIKPILNGVPTMGKDHKTTHHLQIIMIREGTGANPQPHSWDIIMNIRRWNESEDVHINVNELELAVNWDNRAFNNSEIKAHWEEKVSTAIKKFRDTKDGMDWEGAIGIMDMKDISRLERIGIPRKNIKKVAELMYNHRGKPILQRYREWEEARQKRQARNIRITKKPTYNFRVIHPERDDTIRIKKIKKKKVRFEVRKKKREQNQGGRAGKRRRMEGPGDATLTRDKTTNNKKRKDGRQGDDNTNRQKKLRREDATPNADKGTWVIFYDSDGGSDHESDKDSNPNFTHDSNRNNSSNSSNEDRDRKIDANSTDRNNGNDKYNDNKKRSRSAHQAVGEDENPKRTKGDKTKKRSMTTRTRRKCKRRKRDDGHDTGQT
jgi:ribonuclease HI